MKVFFMTVAAGILAFSGYWCLSGNSVGVVYPVVAEKSKKSLPAFKSEKELEGFFQELKKKSRKAGGGGGGGLVEDHKESVGALTSTVEISAAPVPGDMQASVTNVQHAGVDEGGIVKLHRDYLIVLRRGRLFTVSMKNGSLNPVSSIDAFGPDLDPDDAWYDEMLISGDTIVVIGYSYEREGSEVGVFNINRDGQLRYRSTYHLRSNDYYSSRNYASRLIGNKLIFYSPLYLDFDAETVADSLPATRRWRKGVTDKDFKRIVPATRVYRGGRDFNSNDPVALHTVTTCDLNVGELACEATSVVGPPGNVFYVSPKSVYVWTSTWFEDDDKPILYRMPLDGSAPSAIEVSGSPVDQFAFLESGDGHLNVLVVSQSQGNGMWAAETAEGDVALMRVPLETFADGSTAVPASQYRALIRPEDGGFQNRFVGDYIFYGTGTGWNLPEPKVSGHLYAARWDGTGGLWKLSVQHGVDRIEPLGGHAMVIGSDGQNLHFTSVRLGDNMSLAGHYKMANASQGETRSHGFFYKPHDADSGVVGLPVRGPASPAYQQLFEDSASIVFVQNKSLSLKPIGELKPDMRGAVDDGCRASCVDWYGNARPLFIRGRVFALLGYELVEGTLDGSAIREVRRASFAPLKRQSLRNE